MRGGEWRDLGRGRGTFLEKGSPSPSKPPLSPPKTFDLIESLFVARGKIGILPCENGFEKGCVIGNG